MAEEHRNAILEKLDDANVEYHHEVHDPVRTSEEASQVRGVPLSSGAKAIVLRGSKTKQHYLAVIPADRRLNSKAIKELIGEKVSFALDVDDSINCVPGSVPPFGSVIGLATYADEALEEVLNFNIGLLTESVRMSKKDYVLIEQPTMGQFSEPRTN